MAEGLGRRRWAHTSLICALIANAHRDPKKHRPFRPSDFDPYAKQSRRTDAIEVNAETVGLMREAFASRFGKQKGR